MIPFHNISPDSLKFQYELGGAGENVAEDDLVSLYLIGLPNYWDNYHDYVNERKKLPNWERLWFDLVQEEIRSNTRDGVSSKVEDGDNFV